MRVGRTTYFSSVLPWHSSGAYPWIGERHVDKTESAVEELLVHLRGVTLLVWGGDWNHALTRKEYAGSMGGRRAVLAAFGSLALPAGLRATASRIEATNHGKRLSDHDAYVVEADL